MSDKLVQDMTEDEFIDHCLADMMGGWIPVSRYLKLYPEENADKIASRVRRGVWQRRVHYSTPGGGHAWVNLRKIREWMEGPQEVAKED